MLQRMNNALQVLRGTVSVTRGRIMANVGAEQQYRWPDLGQVKNQQQQFIDSSIVYIAITRITRSAGTVEFIAKDKGGTKLKQHWFLDLLRKPNSWMSQFELLESTWGQLFLTGNAYWFTVGHDEIIPLRPDRIRIVAGPDTQTYVRGYVYTVNSVDIPLQPQDVVHFKLFHPKDDFLGLSPLLPGALPVQSDLAMSRWNRGWFSDRNGSPPSMVSVEPTVTDTEFERIQEDFQRNYSTNNREQKTLFVRGGAITYTDMSHTNKEMEFLAGRKLNKEEVMLAYGITPGMLDVNATEANALAGKEVFIDQTLWPVLVMFGQKVTATLTADEGVTIEPRDIRIKDATALLREVQGLASILSVDELRAKFDYEPATWDGHDKPPAGADAPIPSPVGGKPNVDKSPEQIQSADAAASQSAASPFKADDEAYKGLETDEQRKWFFANLKDGNVGGDQASRPANNAPVKPVDVTSMTVHSNSGIHHNVPAQGKQVGDFIAHRDIKYEGYSDPVGFEEKGGWTVTHAPTGMKMTDGFNKRDALAAAHEYHTIATGKDLSSLGRETPLAKAVIGVHGKWMRNNYPRAFKADEDYDVSPVTLTGPMRAERAQFYRYAAKGKPVDRFNFLQCPASIEIAYKAIADINELDLLTAKAIMPAASRVSIGGVRDPNAKEKEASAKALVPVILEALAELQAALVDASKHNRTIDAAWWRSAEAAFDAKVYPAYYDQLELAAQDSADVASVQSGVGFDDASLAPYVRDATDNWIADWVSGIIQTTRAAYEAMKARWDSAVSPKIQDLISAIQESPVFGEDRATSISETENTRLWGTANVIGALVVAAASGQKVDDSWLARVDDLLPAHPGCVCYTQGGVWYAVHDGHKICATCSERDGKTLQEIQDSNL